MRGAPESGLLQKDLPLAPQARGLQACTEVTCVLQESLLCWTAAVAAAWVFAEGGLVPCLQIWGATPFRCT